MRLPSIKRTLMLWLSLGMGGAILIAALMIYSQAREEANQLFDYQMRQLVASLPDRAFAPLAPGRMTSDDDTQRDVVIQIWDNNGMRIYRSHENTALPQRAELGFTNATARGADWRVYSAQLGDTIVQVAQPMRDRLRLAAKMALKTVAPLLLILPFLALLIWFTVGRGLASIGRVANEVTTRDAAQLAPVSEARLPLEVLPLIVALNDLLKRLAQSMTAQRNFIADAAHELKTPLTALSIQVQLAERTENEQVREAALTDAKQGLERMNHLVHQLLSLARQEPEAFERMQESVDLAQLAAQVVANFAPRAESLGIDLGLHSITASVPGNADALRTLLDNLIDNALQYCPAGSVVNVVIEAQSDGLVLAVADNGPGIPEQELVRVFDRFYRVSGSQGNGSGLGLAIVKQIVAMHDADLIAHNAQPGLFVGIKFSGLSLP